MEESGKLIAIYGINGIGKTTQVELLVDYLKSKGYKASRLKYPIYDLEPEGPFLNKYLRDEGFRNANPKTVHELQFIYAQNRLRYEPTLKKRLAAGEWIIAEDYCGTGIAWGLAWGGDLYPLERMNEQFQEDLAILMHGDRFLTAIESTHRNETNDERIILCKNFLLLLGDKYGWKIVSANRAIRLVHNSIVEMVDGYLLELEEEE